MTWKPLQAADIVFYAHVETDAKTASRAFGLASTENELHFHTMGKLDTSNLLLLAGCVKSVYDCLIVKS